MSVMIENQGLAATINEHGAELVSLIDKSTGKEYLWSGDSKYWQYKSPISFPTIGRLKDDRYRVDGYEYQLPRCGFARNLDFELISQKDNQAVLELHSSLTTKKFYPYDFILRVSYILNNHTIQVEYEVENPTEDEMWFSLGSQPAFKIPLDRTHYFDDYLIKIDPQTTRNRIPLKGSYADIDHLQEERQSELEVSHAMFKDDTMIFDLGEVPTTVKLSDLDEKHGIQMMIRDAKYLGIWSSYPQKGKFVCLEPWWGICDTVDSDQEFKHKFANNYLEGHQIFKTGYTISVF